MASEADFGFAFNDINFSDRILRIEITDDEPVDERIRRIEITDDGPVDAPPDPDACATIADWVRHRKRRRKDIKKENDVDHAMLPEEQVLNKYQPDADDFLECEKEDDDLVVIVEESPSGDETVDADWNFVRSVKTLHMSSPILAAKSPYFYELFSNKTKQSEQRHVTLKINASEEGALMQLLNFMYSSTLTNTSAPAVLDVLMVADKFKVASCMRHCSSLLRNMPMTADSALLYIDLPSSVEMAETVQPLCDAAKLFLVNKFKDIAKYQEELMTLPLAGIEAVISSDDLQVASEDVVYDFILKWARSRYGKLEERRQVLSNRLSHFIRFPHMSTRKLRKVLTCKDFDYEVASNLVLEALFYKVEVPHRQRSLAAGDSSSLYHRFVERAFKYRPVKVVEFEFPHKQCIVYLDLKREECANLFPSGRVYSQAFHLGGQGFFLSAHCNMDQQSSFHCFGLFLGMQEKGSVGFTVEYEFAVRSKPMEDFGSKYKGSYTFTGGKAVGYRNLFAIPWTSFMAEDCRYFINGVLHLRAELTIRN
ncbi:BTB/POZ domain-containing protein POB1-like isoform X1 [Arachis stenosperma]|uniref:BTB/POZ domain-containing protein POB1-like isoform X1 n=1 Tax=Arachis stenosperma TaxID=217475 RepID=UPI0025AC4D17|nr:BTB/POZ domain-containing protein POB1-like isoform X1 [Arachis stenosperma]